MRSFLFRRPRSTALQITLVYLVAGCVMLETAIFLGWGRVGAFLLVAVSALVVYALAQRSASRLRHSHDALRQANERYAAFVRNSSEGVWRIEIDPPMPLALGTEERIDWFYRHGTYTEVNEAFLAMYGSSSARDLVGLPMKDTLPRDRENVAMLRAFFESDLRITGAVSREIAPDGREIFMRSNAAGIVRDGYLERVWGSQQDVTELRRASTAVERQERLLKGAERIAEIGSWTYDPETEKLEWSDNFFRLCGVEPGAFEPTRDAVLSCLHRDDRRGWYRALRRTGTTGVPLDREVRFFRPDGSIGFFYTRAEPVYGDDGEVEVVVGVSRDITRRRQSELAQKELEMQVRQLQRLEAIGTLAGGIAHDFNNILGAVMGYTDMALVDLAPEHPARASLEEIEKASLRAKDLVEQILSYSRKMERQRRIVSLDALAREVLGLMRASLSANVEIRDEIRVTSAKVQADGSQLHQVIVNLCTNAAQAMPDGGRLVVDLQPFTSPRPIDTSTVQLPPGTYLRLSVSDTGHGMDATTLERIFEPFFTTKGPRQGTGLGLSTVKGIVLEHQGGIDVRSEPGRGTTFEIYLPAAQEEVAMNELTAAAVASGRGTVLLLDDEMPLMTLGEKMLDRLGYRPVAFHSAAAALEAFRRAPDRFDLVITDLRMPEMSGLELAREIRQLVPDIPIVLSTGYSDPELERFVADGLLCSLLDKPFNLRTLGDCVARALGREIPAQDADDPADAASSRTGAALENLQGTETDGIVH